MLERPSFRFYICCLVFFSSLTTCTLRIHFSMTIVEMVHGNESNTIPCSNILTDVIPKTSEYNWNKFIESFILSSYYLGYLSFSFPAELISNKFGPYRIIVLMRILSAVFNIFTTFGILYIPSWVLLFFGRFLIGCVESFIHPATESLMSNWIPPGERVKYAGAFLGNAFGMFITWPISGLLIHYIGWEWSFHQVTIQVVIFCILFGLYASDGPQNNRWISEEEKLTIAQNMSETYLRKKVNYRNLLHSKPFWALTAAQFGSTWYLNQQFNHLPKFINEMFEYSMLSVGFIGILPFIARFIFGYIFGFLANLYVKLKIRLEMRIVFTIISHIFPALLIPFIFSIGCDLFSIMCLLVGAQALNGALVVSTIKTARDLSGFQYLWNVYSFVNLIANTSGFIEALITGAILLSNDRLSSWQWMFQTSAIVFLSSGTVFLVFGSSEWQNWGEE